MFDPAWRRRPLSTGVDGCAASICRKVEILLTGRVDMLRRTRDRSRSNAAIRLCSRPPGEPYRPSHFFDFCEVAHWVEPRVPVRISLPIWGLITEFSMKYAFAALVLLGLSVIAAPSFAADARNVSVVNETGYAIKFLGFNAPDDGLDEWDNELEGTLENQASTYVEFNDQDEGCVWNVRVDWAKLQ
jgi:hypothetical protein